jgi:Tfp pilus assembly protein PilO
MSTELLAVFRSRKILIFAAVGLVILLIWVEAVFNPEGHKLASVNANVQAAQTQQSALQARLDRLKVYSSESGQFQALAQRLSAAVPSSTGVYGYITAISTAASTAGMKVASISPSQVTSEGTLEVVPIVVTASGTYSQTLAFIQALYALPRLTVINQVSISGGGTGTNRNTVLSDQLDLDIFPTQSSTQAASG